jgi:hypothetical protein
MAAFRLLLVGAHLVLCWLFGFAPAFAAESGAQTQADGRLVYVTVAGAPGDGEEALAAALTRHLLAAGLKPADAFQANVYEIQGSVRVAPAPVGKESIRIVWVVLGPDGTQLGVVKQMNEVRKGSLDRRWGDAAYAAASDAAAQIVGLIPKDKGKSP